jgi:hypothetical protein
LIPGITDATFYQT